MRFCRKDCYCKSMAPKSSCLISAEGDRPNCYPSTTWQLSCALQTLVFSFIYFELREGLAPFSRAATLNYKHSKMGNTKFSVKWKRTARNKGRSLKTNSTCLPPSHLLPLTGTGERANGGARNHKQTILIPESLLSLAQRNAAEYRYTYCTVFCNATTPIGRLST